MKEKYILSIDQGTTSSRAVIFNREGALIGIAGKPLKQIYPNPGWVEHDPVEIWESQLEVIKSVLRDNNITTDQIQCIGVTNQRETVVVWDRFTGMPVYNAIVWQCRRTAPICNEIKAAGLEESIRRKTGLLIDAYFSGTKLKWILDNVKDGYQRAKAGDLLAGTIDTWLIWNLSGGKYHVTDYTNASRTMLYNINELKWDSDILNKLGIPQQMLPSVLPSSGFAGFTTADILGREIPISGIAGDQQASLFGQACFTTGSAKNTYGTGCFILMNIGKSPVCSANNLITTIAWGTDEGVEYALEGSVFNAGSSVQWLRDGLGVIETAAQSESEAIKVSSSEGVFVVPAFTGLGAPYWDMYARGAIVGMTRGTRKEHIIRATLEAIAYQTRDVIEAMEADSAIKLKELKVDGGASRNGFLMQFQADILGTGVNRPVISETTALGAAYLAGLGSGLWKNKDEIKAKWVSDKFYSPSMGGQERDERYKRWKRAVERALKWEDGDLI